METKSEGVNASMRWGLKEYWMSSDAIDSLRHQYRLEMKSLKMENDITKITVTTLKSFLWQKDALGVILTL